MPYRDDIPRVSIAQLRAQFTPRRFRALVSARLSVGGVEGVVALVDGDGQGFVSSARRWMLCPRCERQVNVVGAVAGLGWVCARCGGWRSRNRALQSGDVVDEGPRVHRGAREVHAERSDVPAGAEEENSNTPHGYGPVDELAQPFELRTGLGT
jgi:hypothetical protein